MTKLFSDDILNSQALKRRKSWLVPAYFLQGVSEMKTMSNYISNCLEHSNHSWSECHFSEHSWCENECWHENSSSNCKSIFVSGVSA